MSAPSSPSYLGLDLRPHRLREMLASRRVRKMDGRRHAEYLREKGYRIGEHCSIPPGTALPMPELIRIGDNVRFSSNVTLLPYEGSIAMLNRAYGVRLDRVGAITIEDNVSYV